MWAHSSLVLISFSSRVFYVLFFFPFGTPLRTRVSCSHTGYLWGSFRFQRRHTEKEKKHAYIYNTVKWRDEKQKIANVLKRNRINGSLEIVHMCICVKGKAACIHYTKSLFYQHTENKRQACKESWMVVNV